MSVKELYDCIEVDPTEVLQRFGGSEAMLQKFIKKFLNDGTFVQLEAAVAAKDWETTFRAAHTLKGLSGNFDFKKLHELSTKIVEQYRANDFEPIPALFEELKACYTFTVESINKYLE